MCLPREKRAIVSLYWQVFTNESLFTNYLLCKIVLPLLTIAVAPSDSNCQYLPDESFTSSESKLSLEEDAAIRLKIAEHAEKMSAITTDMKRRMDSLILPRASNASGNTAEQQPEQKKSLRNFKRKLNA